ncbi:MAG: hypothetical protein K2R93_08780 [Gemmatimonadaceae bacterium]|nr:hypothetical protein [Gemmatimonadaceae bacterium]
MFARITLLVLALVSETASLSSGTEARSTVPNPPLVIAASAPQDGGTDATCSTYPCPAGYRWYRFIDPNCPDNPDTYEAYVEYWNADNSFAYDTYAGHATYWCLGYQASTVGSSAVYQNCVANSPWNCLDLGYEESPHGLLGFESLDGVAAAVTRYRTMGLPERDHGQQHHRS